MRINGNFISRIKRYMESRDSDLDPNYLANEIIAEFILAPDNIGDMKRVIEYHLPTLTEIIRIIMEGTIQVADENIEKLTEEMLEDRLNKVELTLLEQLLNEKETDLFQVIKQRAIVLRNAQKG